MYNKGKRRVINVKQIKTDKAPAAIGPYSQAIISGNTVYCSGQIPINPETGEIPEGVANQAHQVFKNIKNLLEAAGTSIDKVIKTSVFIKDMNDFAEINAIYAEYFTEPYPARSCVEVARLPKDVLLETEVIAEL
ncbi:MAG: RidA family protein [Clostridia bacterium]|nr:RidA family protein [Clostridia bacterium]